MARLPGAFPRRRAAGIPGGREPAGSADPTSSRGPNHPTHPAQAGIRAPRSEDAEARACELLRSVVGDVAWHQYEELGLLCVYGPAEEDGNPGYGYLIYPHRPVLCFDARDGRLLSELCVRFLDDSDPELGSRLPDADDVLAKWMALRGDEHGLLAAANVDEPGRQIDPVAARRDIGRVSELAGLRVPEPT